MIVTKRWAGMRWTRQCRARRWWQGGDGLSQTRERPDGAQTYGTGAYGQVVWS